MRSRGAPGVSTLTALPNNTHSAGTPFVCPALFRVMAGGSFLPRWGNLCALSQSGDVISPVCPFSPGHVTGERCHPSSLEPREYLSPGPQNHPFCPKTSRQGSVLLVLQRAWLNPAMPLMISRDPNNVHSTESAGQTHGEIPPTLLFPASSHSGAVSQIFPSTYIEDTFSLRSLHPSRLITHPVPPVFQTFPVPLCCSQCDLIKHHLQIQLLCHLSSPSLMFIPNKTKPSVGSSTGRCAMWAPKPALLWNQLIPPGIFYKMQDEMLCVLPGFIHQCLPPERVQSPVKYQLALTALVCPLINSSLELLVALLSFESIKCLFLNPQFLWHSLSGR